MLSGTAESWSTEAAFRSFGPLDGSEGVESNCMPSQRQGLPSAREGRDNLLEIRLISPVIGVSSSIMLSTCWLQAIHWLLGLALVKRKQSSNSTSGSTSAKLAALCLHVQPPRLVVVASARGMATLLTLLSNPCATLRTPSSLTKRQSPKSSRTACKLCNFSKPRPKPLSPVSVMEMQPPKSKRNLNSRVCLPKPRPKSFRSASFVIWLQCLKSKFKFSNCRKEAKPFPRPFRPVSPMLHR
mmetsp:Transcript_85274/g.275212  ORF Transcript_85274/g.275212 Transcript_85274/m.275212 type:complete len:241 (+) Transcript_85274:1130-1852(+)